MTPVDAPWPGCLRESGYCVLARDVQGNHVLEADDLKDPAYVVVCAYHRERSASFAQPLERADEDPYRGEVDEADIGQVDHDQPVAHVDSVHDAHLELWRNWDPDVSAYEDGVVL